MTAPHGRLLNRGATILSAVVFVALLAGVATTVQYFSPYANIESQTAAPGGIGSDTVAAQQAAAKAELGNKCTAAIAQAKTTGKASTSKTGETANTDCVAAIKTADPAYQKTGGYKCVGKSVQVMSQSDGTLKINWQANPNAQPGVCKTLACRSTWEKSVIGVSTGGRCFLGELDSIDKSKIASGVEGANSFYMGRTPGMFLPGGESNLTPFGGPLSADQQKLLNEAFGKDPNTTDSSVPLDSNGEFKSPAFEQIKKYAEQNPDQGAVDASKKVTDAAVELNPDLADKSVLAAPKLKVEDIQRCLKDASLPGCINRGPENGNPVCPGGNCGRGTFPDPNAGKNTGGNSNPMSALGSMLQGLMKALGAAPPPPPPSAPAQACATDQNAYTQQQQQYQQQLQQYNYQLQQYQYQQQLNQLYAERNGGIAPPTQPPPAQPTPCTPVTGSQCRAQPQQPPASACTAGAWRATYSGACISGWQCISTQGPKAELVCEPQVADAGSTLALTYSCSSGVASSSAFKVTTQPGGSATTTVKAPPAGTNTATYTLACTDNGKTTGAQCSVQVSRTNIILVANPRTVRSGETSLLSWLTTGMRSCVISSPDQPDFTARNSSNTSVTGAATTSPITSSSARFLLHCETLAGGIRDATTTVEVSN